jgi:hypothetical protein
MQRTITWHARILGWQKRNPVREACPDFERSAQSKDGDLRGPGRLNSARQARHEPMASCLTCDVSDAGGREMLCHACGADTPSSCASRLIKWALTRLGFVSIRHRGTSFQRASWFAPFAWLGVDVQSRGGVGRPSEPWSSPNYDQPPQAHRLSQASCGCRIR